MMRFGLLCALVVAAGAVGVAGCGGERPTTREAHEPVTLVGAGLTYAADRLLDVRAHRSGEVGLPVVVLLHGCCGDRADVTRLADRVASDGAVVMTPDWGGTGEGATYPDTFEAVACAVRYAREHATRYGGDSDRVVLVGWSDGALAAANVALTGDSLSDDDCVATGPSGRPDALVGLAGYYGWTLPVPEHLVTPRAIRFMGGNPNDAPEAWQRSTPYPWVDGASAMPASLVVGADDPLRGDAERFYRHLDHAGWPVRLDVVPFDGEPTLLSPRSAEGRRVLASVRWTIDQLDHQPRPSCQREDTSAANPAM